MLQERESEKQSQSLSHVRLSATPWTVAQQAPLSMEFSRYEYWSGWPFPSPGALRHPGIKPISHVAGRFFTLWTQEHEIHVNGMDHISEWEDQKGRTEVKTLKGLKSQFVSLFNINS